MKMHYEPIGPLDKIQAERAFATADTGKVVNALLGATFHEPDWEWVEKTCLNYLESNITEVRQTAITCLGHLARIHGKLHKAKVLQALSKYSADADFAGRIEDAIDDIEMFVK